jgi:SAM-dependent methyltransferase
MAYDYDKLYGSTPQALGEPTKAFVDFFKRQKNESFRVLDVGCGQGRDALFIARLGHRVVGVDISANGIREMVDIASQENLEVEGYATDIATYVPEGDFDVLLIDRTLHMLPNKERLEVLERLIRHIPKNGWALIADERSNMQGFKDVFEASSGVWKAELEMRGTLFLRHT